MVQEDNMSSFQRRRVYLFAVVFVVMLCGLGVSSWADLKIHPENPHYFINTNTGKPVMITSYGTVTPTSSAIDYTRDIFAHSSKGMPYVRIWHFLPWEGSNAIWPWARGDVPGAYMGGNKIEMNTWNPVYWSRLKDCLTRLQSAGQYSEITFFDRCGMSAGELRWANNPWASDNNDDYLELPGGSGEGVPAFYDYFSKPRLGYYQELFVKKMIDETISFPNLIYEIENEHMLNDDSSFAAYYAKLVKDYIQSRYPDSQRLTAYSSLENDLDDCLTNPYIDIINKHYGSEFENNPSIVNSYIEARWKYNKAINIDEFANLVSDYNLLTKQCWTIVTSGGNFHIEDALPEAKPYSVVNNIESFKSQSGWDFIHASPMKSLIASDGYCMAKPGVEYVCYFTTGGNKSIYLPYGKFTARWWDPEIGGFSNEAAFSHSGGYKMLTTPSASDWVLQIKKSDGTGTNPYPYPYPYPYPDPGGDGDQSELVKVTISQPSTLQTSTGPVWFDVNFSKPVTGFNSVEDIKVNISGTVQVSYITINGSGAGPYKVELSGISGTGSVGITVKAGVCTDPAGNLNVESAASQTCTVINFMYRFPIWPIIIPYGNQGFDIFP